MPVRPLQTRPAGKTLRTKYQGAALAAVAGIAHEVKVWTSDQRGIVATAYPLYAAWLSERLSDHRDVMTNSSELEDYAHGPAKL